MVTTGLQPDPRKFLHQCQHCARKYRVTIRVDIRTVHRANCPHCGKTNYFDNKKGQIRRLVDGEAAPKPATQVPVSTPAVSGAYRPESKFSLPSPGTVAPTVERSSPREEAPDRSMRPPAPAFHASSSSGIRSDQTTAGPSIRSWRADSGRAGFMGRQPAREVPSPPSGGFRSGGDSPFRSGGSSASILRPAGVMLDVWRGFTENFDLRIAALALVVMGLVAGLAGIAIFRTASFWIPGGMDQYTARLQVIEPNRIVDRDGNLLAELFSRRTGTMTSDQIPATLKQKLIFVEDQNFYEHGGIHYPSLIRAALANVFSLGYAQGGSTLTQQLARILLGSREKVISRKIREANLAYYLEDHYTKDDILTAYMNHVYLGHGSVGMDVAARFYFGRKLSELNFVQELMLVSLPSAPERYSPLKNPMGLQSKMDAVYLRMRREGFTDMPAQSYNSMKQAVFTTLNRSPNANVFASRVDRAPFVTEYVRLQIRQIMGEEFEFGAGLRIETTIQRGVQETVARETTRYLTKAQSRFAPVRYVDGKRVKRQDIETRIARHYHHMGLGMQLLGFPAADVSDHVLQAAAVGIRPQTGEVLFLQGGRRFSTKNQYNRAINMYRQTGSAIKPVIYATAIQSGHITPASLVDDSPIYVPLRRENSGGKGYWLPQNISGKYEGLIPIRKAFARSKNIPAIRVARLVGLPLLSEQFRKFFFHDERSFKQRFRWDQTIAIGSLEMSPLEMAVAFSAFGADGKIHRPYIIKRILDREGKELYHHADKDEFRLNMPSEIQALAPDAAFVMSSLMRDSARYGGLHRGGLKAKHVMGKTGTSNDYRDTWFVGLVPGVSAAVWVGYDDPRYSMKGGTGAAVAGPLWARILEKTRKILPREKQAGWKFSAKPVRKAVCAQSGKLPGPYCPVVSDWHRKAHLPGEVCPLEHFDPNAYEENWSVNSDTDFN